jgi:phage host-nuclease inhibitor protein Gam
MQRTVELTPGTGDPLAAAAPEAFRVRDEASANWVVRRVLEARKYAEHVEAWAATELRRAEREERFFLERYGPQLEAWARQRLTEGRARGKSVRLPAGTVGFRATPPHLAVTDEPALLRWCKSHLPRAVRTRVREQVLKNALQEHVRSTGECPQGAEVVAGGERFFVR